MAIKRVGYDVEPGFLKGCDAQIESRIMSKWFLTKSMVLMTMVEMMMNLV